MSGEWVRMPAAITEKMIDAWTGESSYEAGYAAMVKAAPKPEDFAPRATIPTDFVPYDGGVDLTPAGAR